MCIDAGAPIKITFLNDIEAALTQTCDGPSFTLTGGYPEFFPGTFGVVNNGLGALSASTVNHAGTFTITGLTSGQAYNFTVTDNNGCPKTFSGTYTYTPPTLAITGLGSSFCVGDPVDAFTATPIGTSTTYTASTTGGVTIHLESDGYCNEWTWYIDDALGNVVAAGNTWSNASLCNLPANSNLAPIVVNGLNLLNGPFTFHIIDDFSDGQGGGAGPADDGSVYITNNNGGAQIGPTRSGNWGASATISLAGLTPTSTVTYTVTSVGTLSGTDVTQTGNVSGDFDPNTVGTYPVTYTYDDGRSCVFTQSQNVTVNQVPALSTPTNPVICAGQSITLSTYNPIDANGTTGVGVWHVGNTPAGAVVTTVTPTNGQQYCYEWTANGNCRDNKVITVTVNALPTVTATSFTVCQGGSATITAGGASSYLWNTGVTTAGLTINPVSATTTYTVTGTDANTCTNTATGTITMLARPTVTATSFTVCEGSSATITAGGASTYVWNTGVTTAGLTINPVTATTTYTVTGTAANTCTNTATGTITMNTRPTVTATSFTVCQGSSATITAGGANTYVWNTGVATAGLTINPVSATTTYTVTGTAANTCTNTATGTITMNPRPTVTATSFTVCQGGSATITAGGASSYSWNTGVTTAGLTINPVSATATYTVTGTDANTCTNTATGTITMLARPTVTATSFTVCEGSSATITAGGASTYVWNTGVTTAGLTINPVTATTTYTVTGTAANTCTNTATGTITMNTRPTVTATSFTVCQGSSATITAGGANTYVWNTGVSTAGLTINPVSATTTYTVTGTAANTCTNTATGTITMNPRPTVTATSFTVCQGSSATITAGGANTYLWNTGVATAGLTINPVSATTTYTVTGTDANTCTNTATGTITMNPLPTVTAATSSQSVCSGGTVSPITFVTNPATGVTVNWTNSNTGIGLVASGSGSTIGGFAAPVVAIQTQGVISAVATITASGCSNTAIATGTVTINPLPAITNPATPNPNIAICGGTGSLTGFTATGIGAISYSWITTPVQNTQNATGLIAGTYSVVATDASTGCSVTSPGYTLSDPSMPPSPTFNVTSNAVCAGTPITLSVVSPIGGSTYNWSGPSGSLGAGTSITITPTVTGNYNVSVTTAGCTSNPSVNTSVVVNANPTATVTGNGTQFCEQTNFVLSATSSTGGGTASIAGYQWYGPSGLIAGATSSTYTTSVAGSYSVMVTDNNAPVCQNTSAAYVITNYPEPVLSAGAAAITNSDCVNPTGSISGITVSSGSANYTYTWLGAGAGFPIVSTIASTTAPALTNQPAGTYTLAVSDANGCKDTTSAYTINNLSAPNTPLVATNNPNCSGSSMNPITLNDVTNVITWYSDPGLTTSVGTGNPFTPVTTTTHTLYVTSTASGCSSAATTVTVTVNPKPAAPAAVGNTYCAGQTISDLTITSSIGVGSTINWYNSTMASVGNGTPFASGVSNNVAATTTTTFFVTELSALLCESDPTQVDITVHPNPLIDTTNMVTDTASCDGTANGGLTNIVVTSGTAPFTFVWTNSLGATVSSSGSSADLDPLTGFPTGSYTLTVTDANTCNATQAAAIVAFNQPQTPTLTVAANDLLYCDGETVNALTAASSHPIFWYPDASLTGAPVGTGPTFTPVAVTTDTTFYLVSNNGCVSVPLSVNIDFHAAPSVPTVSDAVYCRGDVVADLVATGTNVSWFADNITTINIGTGSPFASGVSNAGVTTIWYTDSIAYTGITCGSDTGSVTITIHNLPVIDITTSLVVDSATCGATSSGGSITGVLVTGTPGLTYTWSNSTGVVSTSTTTANLVNQAAGSYTLVVTDGNTPSCSATSSAITINTYSNPTNPVFVTSSDTVYCDGETVTALQANSSTGILQWYSDAALTTMIGSGSPFTPTGITSSTTIYLVASNFNCKSDSIPISINFNQLPNISANSPTVCDGGQVTLSGTNASGNSTTYIWDNGTGPIDGVAFTPTLPGGSYVVTGTDNVTNCVNTFTTTVTVLSTPTVGATVGSSASVCSGGTLTLSGTGASGYTWTGGVIDGVAFTPAGIGSYTVTGTDPATTCTNTFVVNVSIDSPPTINTGVSATIPCGSTSSVITGVTTNAATPVYTWTGPNVVADGNTASPTLGAAGQYTLTVVDNATGCSSTSTLDIVTDAVFAALTPDVLAGFSPLPVTFTNQSTGATSYTWDFGDGQTASTTTLASVSNTFVGNGTYTVTLTASSNSCAATATVTIIVNENSTIVVPNIFSPNGDNVNDVLTITSTGLSELTIDIFNRWGSKVYVIDSPGQNWDGKLTNGEPAAEGTYFYILKAVGFDKKEYEAQGPIMLVK
ncbi:MAG: gliding motility-associated C-terminal domain-containing protein [Bacteroidetes bacterium]|nr:gliding motility-associated C-terminal domain-containing protein [Bacteroidota bacterium]